jgi:GAF domain-containing protein
MIFTVHTWPWRLNRHTPIEECKLIKFEDLTVEDMTVIEKPANEPERLEALKRYEILDTPPDGSFDHLTQLAATLFNVPIALVSLVDENRIWFKSRHGLAVQQIDRDPGLCASAILSPDLYIVENAREDARTLSNPLVAGNFGLRFYAAAPLLTKEGYNLGTFCIIDRKQRYITESQKEILKRLADIVMDEMEIRLSARHLLANTSQHLKNTLQAIAAVPASAQTENLRSLMSTSRKLIQDIDRQINAPGSN